MYMKISLFKSNMLAMGILLASFHSCNFAQSINKDLATGLVTRGNGLACDDVYLSTDKENIKRSTFIYGETIYLNFSSIEGFNRQGESAFPGMQLVVVSHQGDTVLYQNDLYETYAEGMVFSPLKLNSKITVADPIHSKGEYSLFVNIWDKKGDGTFKATLDFTVIPNDKIEITNNQISFSEIYLYSQQEGIAITSDGVGFNETIYILFEGLEGFHIESGNVFLGLSILIQDADGNVILKEEDLMGDAGISYEDIHSQLAPNFILTGNEISNPVHCEIFIWDKKSMASIKAITQLNVQ